MSDINPIGFVGLGLMGRPMALNLRKAGFPLVVTSRSPGPVQALVEAGAIAAGTPADVAKQCPVIITMLPDSPDVAQVLEGPSGIFETLRHGAVLIDMSTISPVVTRELAAKTKARGATLLDAPVSGGEIGAISGTLSIMVGGDAAALERVRPILAAMGHAERIIHIGESGAGQVAKVCNQLMIGATLSAVGETFALARKAGVDPSRVRQALMGGFAASRVLEVHGERVIKGDFKPGFRASMYQKDLRIALETLRSHNVAAPVSAVVQQLVSALIASGRGADDYSALAMVLFDLARVETKEVSA